MGMPQGETQQPIVQAAQTPPPGELNKHDLRVIAFHVIVAMIQAGLITIGAYDFGKYNAIVALGIQAASEFVRRLIV